MKINIFYGDHLDILLELLPIDIAEDMLLFQVVSRTMKIAAKQNSSEKHEFDLKDIQSDYFNPDIIISPINERTADSPPDDHQGTQVNFMENLSNRKPL